MPATASESPIAISSTSPTPERPSLRPGRSSSSSLLNEITTAGPSTRRTHAQSARQPHREQDVFTADNSTENERAIQPIPTRAVDPRRRAQPFVLVPTARAFRPASSIRPEQGLAIPSRTSSPATSNATNGSGAGQVVDLTEDDDDVEFIGVAEPAPRARARRTGTVQDGPIWRDLRRIDEVAAERGLAVRDILNDPDLQRRRQVLPPTPVPAGRLPARPRRAHFQHDDDARPQDVDRNPRAPRPEAERQRPRIGLGGAVLRQGDRQINYNNHAPRADADADVRRAAAAAMRANARRQYQQNAARANLDEEINERIQRRLRDRDDGGYAGVADLLNGVMDNWGVAQGMNGILGGARAGLMERVRMMRAEHLWGGGAGPAGMANQRRQDDPQTIIAQVPKFDYPPLPDGFTSNFEIDSTIEIDQPATSKRYLACAYCADPLLLSSGHKTPLDRVWSLRCGHLIDQKCLEKLSAPRPEDGNAPPAGLPFLGEDDTAAVNGNGGSRGGRKAKKARPNTRKAASKPVEYEWTCPAKECGHQHKSVLKDGEWTQTELEGALQLYA